MSLFVILTGLQLCALAPEASTQPVRVDGKVTQTTSRRVYLDHGAAAGVAPGQTVTLRHRRQRAGTCVVESTTTRGAACVLEGEVESAADRFRVEVPPPAAARPKVPRGQREAPPRAALTDATFAAVPYDAPPRPSRAAFTAPAEVGVAFTSAVSGLDGNRQFHRARLFFGISGAQLYVPGLRLFARGRIDGVLNPAGTRFRKDEPVRVEVNELALMYRDTQSYITGALGRFTPFSAPGVPTLDGAQAGLSFLGGDVEFGAYAGVIPDATNLYPRLNSFTGGGYWSAATRFGDFRVRNTGRIGAIGALDYARAGEGSAPPTARIEGETHLRTGFGRMLEAAAGVRAAMGSESIVPGLDLGYAEATARPGFGFFLGGRYRYRAPYTSDVSIGVLPGLLSGTHHADAHAGWVPPFAALDWLSIAARTNAGYFVTSGTWRASLGPELGTPGLLNGRLGFYGGYQETLGWLAGRHLYMRTHIQPGFGLYASARAFYADTHGLPDVSRSVGGDFRVEQHFLRWLRVFARARGELMLPSIKGYASVPLSTVHGTGTVGAAASF